MAAVTSDHTQHGKAGKLTLLQCWRSEDLNWAHRAKAKVSAGLLSSVDSRRTRVLASSGFWRLPAFLGSWPPFSIFTASSGLFSLLSLSASQAPSSYLLSLILTFLPPSLSSQVALVAPAWPMQERLKRWGSIPGSGRSPGESHGNPLQYSSLENPMDRGAWWATVHGVAKSRT